MAASRIQSFLRPGDLARAAGVSTDTLRHYERKGVIARPRRSTNGYREYPPAALDRVRMVRAALALGFTLDELAEVLAVRSRGGRPCRRVRELAGAKLTEVEGRLREMAILRDRLRSTLAAWDARLSGTPPGKHARLLDSLASGGSGEPRIDPRRVRPRRCRGHPGPRSDDRQGEPR